MDTPSSPRKLFSPGSVLLLSVLAVILGYTFQNPLYTNLEKIGLRAAHTPLTELFFTDYLALPATIQAGQTVSVDFTIRNVEGTDMQYPYTVYLITTGGRRIEVANGITEVANEKVAAVHTSYTFKSNSLPVTFYVELSTSGKRISAVVPVPTQ